MSKLVILDRDGVINYDSDNYIKTLDEFVPIDTSINAIAKLNQNGFLVAVATNQSGIGRGFYSEKTLHKMHMRLRKLVNMAGGDLGEILHCPHLPTDNCRCRKPQPELLNRILNYYGKSAENTYFVGDSLSDVLAAKNANCLPILVKTGKGKNTLKSGKLPKDCLIFEDLAEFTNYLVGKNFKK